MNDAHAPTLRELTHQLEASPLVRDYDSDEGHTAGLSILNEPGIAAMKGIMSAGARLQKHEHSVVEILVVYVGRLTIEYDDGGVEEAGPGEVIIIPPNRPHVASTQEYTLMVAMTIPADSGYAGA